MKYRFAVGFLIVAACCYAVSTAETRPISTSNKGLLMEKLIAKYGDATWPERDKILDAENKTVCFIPLISVSKDGVYATGSARIGPLPTGTYELYGVWGQVQGEKLEVENRTEESREVMFYELDVKDEPIEEGKTKTVTVSGHREKRGGWTGTKDVYSRVDRIEVKLDSYAQLEAVYSEPPTTTETQCLAVFAVRRGDLNQK